MTRRLWEIGQEIRATWLKPHYAARPYIDAMLGLGDLSDSYGYDRADSIVLYFLSNAGTWRGPTAKRVKAELKLMLAAHKASKKAKPRG